MQAPLLDLRAQYAAIKDEIIVAVSEVLESQRCIGGPKVAELEEQVASRSDCRFAVGTSSGTDAILNSLMSLDVGPGTEATLVEQPCKAELEYRIVAVNKAGQGEPSNTVMAVL